MHLYLQTVTKSCKIPSSTDGYFTSHHTTHRDHSPHAGCGALWRSSSLVLIRFAPAWQQTAHSTGAALTSLPSGRCASNARGWPGLGVDSRQSHDRGSGDHPGGCNEEMHGLDPNWVTGYMEYFRALGKEVGPWQTERWWTLIILPPSLWHVKEM